MQAIVNPKVNMLNFEKVRVMISNGFVRGV